MHQKLLRKAGLLAVIASALGVMLAGCVDEPNPPVVDKVESSVRFVHAVGDAPAVDVWADGVKIASGLSFKGSSAYVPVRSGNRFIRLLPAGSTDTTQAVFRQLITFRSYSKITSVFYGLVSSSSVSLLSTQERFTYADETKNLVDTADVKLINVNVSEETIKIADGAAGGPTVVGPVAKYTLSSYKKVKAGAYTFFLVTDAGTEMKSFSFTLAAKNRYSFIAVGDLAAPEILLLKDDPQ